jgi:hypothetical protein
VPRVRPVSGTLARIAAYLITGFGAVLATPPPVPARALPWINLARAACREPDPGVAGHAIERISAALAAAEQVLNGAEPEQFMAIGLIHAASTIAVTEPVG